MINSSGTTHPCPEFQKIGFVVCGCLGYYRSTDRTRDLLGRWLSACNELTAKRNMVQLGCDDQSVMNKIYLEELQMTRDVWKIVDLDDGRGAISALKNKCHQFSFGDGFPSRVGVSPKTGIKVAVWNTSLVVRGDGKTIRDCETFRQLWVAMPLVGPKEISAKKHGVDAARKTLSKKRALKCD